MSAFLRYCASMTMEMLFWAAPCATAITLIPERPSVPKSFPMMPGTCFICSPTTAIVASELVVSMGNMAPVAISFSNSSLRMSAAIFASSGLTPTDVEFSDEACETMNTDTPTRASAAKMRRLTPITPTIDKPVTVMSEVAPMLEMPLMGDCERSLVAGSAVGREPMKVPSALGLKVFFTLIGMFFTHTG